MDHKRLSLLLTLIGVLALGATSAARATTFTTHFTGVAAPATWGLPVPVPSPGPSPGPIFPPPILVFLIPLKGHFATNQGPLPTETGMLISLSVLMSDESGLPTLVFNGTSTTASFQVDGRLSSATLSATFQGFDLISQTPKTITITAAWTGIGDVTHMSDAARFKEGGFSIMTHFSGRLRMAVATASLSGDVTATLGESTSATLVKAEDGTVLKTPTGLPFP